MAPRVIISSPRSVITVKASSRPAGTIEPSKPSFAASAGGSVTRTMCQKLRSHGMPNVSSSAVRSARKGLTSSITSTSRRALFAGSRAVVDRPFLFSIAAAKEFAREPGNELSWLAGTLEDVVVYVRVDVGFQFAVHLRCKQLSRVARERHPRVVERSHVAGTLRDVKVVHFLEVLVNPGYNLAVQSRQELDVAAIEVVSIPTAGLFVSQLPVPVGSTSGEMDQVEISLFSQVCSFIHQQLAESTAAPVRMAGRAVDSECTNRVLT